MTESGVPNVAASMGRRSDTCVNNVVLEERISESHLQSADPVTQHKRGSLLDVHIEGSLCGSSKII